MRRGKTRTLGMRKPRLLLAFLLTVCGCAAPTNDHREQATSITKDSDITPEFFTRKPPTGPNAYWASKPSGRFSKDELFTLCSYLGLLVTTSTHSRGQGKEPDRSPLALLHYAKEYESVKSRDPALA